MKKVLVAAAAVAGVALLVAPKIIASHAQSQLAETISAIDGINGYSLTLKESQPGWFSSHNVLTFSLDFTEFMENGSVQDKQALEGLSDVSFDILVDLQHGPVLSGKGIGLVGWNAVVTKVPEGIKLTDAQQKGLYQQQGKTSLGGGISFEDEIAAFEFQDDKADGRLEFSGFAGKGNSVGDQIQYVGSAKSFKINSPDISVLMQDLSVDWLGEFDWQMMHTGVYGDSNVNLKLEKLRFEREGELMADLSGFSMFAVTDMDENHSIDMSLGYGTKAIETPVAAFDDFAIEFDFNNVSSQFLMQYQKLISDGSHLSDTASFMQNMKQHAIAALAFKPEFILKKLSLKHSDGELNSSAGIKLKQYEVPEDKLLDSAFWQKNVLFESHLSVPKAFALSMGKKFMVNKMKQDPAAADLSEVQLTQLAQQQVAPMYQGLLQQGFFVEEAGQVKLAFNFKDGMGELNGKPVPIPGL
jgi:uncharacterized protein YdgA (DUF945 family)